MDSPNEIIERLKEKGLVIDESAYKLKEKVLFLDVDLEKSCEDVEKRTEFVEKLFEEEGLEIEDLSEYCPLKWTSYWLVDKGTPAKEEKLDSDKATIDQMHEEIAMKVLIERERLLRKLYIVEGFDRFGDNGDVVQFRQNEEKRNMIDEHTEMDIEDVLNMEFGFNWINICGRDKGDWPPKQRERLAGMLCAAITPINDADSPSAANKKVAEAVMELYNLKVLPLVRPPEDFFTTCMVKYPSTGEEFGWVTSWVMWVNEY